MESMQVARQKRRASPRVQRAEAPRPLPSERVFSLVATLMEAGRPLTRDEIMERLAELYVPHGHPQPDPETLRKMFERDKALIKDMGIPLVATQDGAGREDLEEGAVGYRIDEAGLHARPVDLDRTQRLLLAAIARAASESPGFPLARDLAIAVQKIMLASGMASGEEDAPFRILEQCGAGAGPSVDARIVEMALDAVERRRSVRIDYMDQGGRVTGRTVDPWGLVRAGGTWLLHGMCHLRKASRTFALHRATGLEILRPGGRGHDFERPEGFSADSISSQRPHEYAVHDPVDVVLEADAGFAFRVEAMTGCPPSRAAAGACRFDVRATNVDALVEIALAYGPRVRILSPADIVDRVVEGARAVGAATGGRGRRPAAGRSRAGSRGRKKASRPAGREDASARLARYTFLVSYLSGRDDADLSEIARILGIPEAEVLRDIERLSLCGVYPSTEFRLFDVSVDAERGKVRLWRNPVPGLAMPVALTSRETAALVLGAKLVRDGIAPPYDWAADRVVARVMEAAGEGIASAMAELEKCVSLGSSRDLSWDVFHEVAIAASKRLRIEIEYYTESRDSLGKRVVRPYVVACTAGRWYLVGWCEWREDVRSFRLDRIRSARPAGGGFDAPKGFDPERHMGGGIYAAAPAPSSGGRGRSGSAAAPAAIVRFDPAFVSDHEGRDGFEFLDGHGGGEVTFVVEPARQEGFLTWLLRMTPRFSIVSPPDLRAALADRRDRLLAAYA